MLKTDLNLMVPDLAFEIVFSKIIPLQTVILENDLGLVYIASIIQGM